METIGDRIKYARKNKGKISQKMLAEWSGIHINSIKRYEQNLSIPSADVIGRIATILRVTTDYLIFGEE